MTNGWMAAMLPLLGVLGLSGPAVAFDGDGHIIDVGASPWRVRELCGEPTAIDGTTEEVPRFVYDPTAESYVPRPVAVPQRVWTYNFGPTRFIYRLTFQDGKLIDIPTGDYGQ